MQQLGFLAKVRGIKKRRDFLILQALAEGVRQCEVANEFGLHKSVVSRIAKRNWDLLNDLTYQSDLATKAGRLRIAFNEIKGKVGNSKKDLLDWLDFIRKELEGEQGVTIMNQLISTNKNNEELNYRKEDKELQERIRRDLQESGIL